jgi:hypothetical protein
MEHRYKLPEHLRAQASSLEEFANGGAQCHAELRDGSIHSGLLISDTGAVIAMRGHDSLPFSVESIARLFQVGEDRSPSQRGGWRYFDDWTLDRTR